MLLARQRSRGSAAFAKAGCTRDLATTKRNRCGGRQPIPTHERDRGGGRNARATSSRSHAVPVCPPAIHPRESPAAAGPAAIIRQAQKTLTFSLHTLSVRTPPPAIKKRSTLVRKLWTKSLPCGNPRKTETTCPIVPTNAIKMRLGAPCLAAFARRGDFLLHHHNRGCPALRDFRRMGHPGPGRYQTMRLPETQAASSRNPRPSKTAKTGAASVNRMPARKSGPASISFHRFRESTPPRSSLCLK